MSYNPNYSFLANAFTFMLALRLECEYTNDCAEYEPMTKEYWLFWRNNNEVIGYNRGLL